MIKRNIWLDPFIWEQLEKVAKATGQNRSTIIRMAIIEKLQKMMKGTL